MEDPESVFRKKSTRRGQKTTLFNRATAGLFDTTVLIPLERFHAYFLAEKLEAAKTPHRKGDEAIVREAKLLTFIEKEEEQAEPEKWAEDVFRNVEITLRGKCKGVGIIF